VRVSVKESFIEWKSEGFVESERVKERVVESEIDNRGV